MRAAQLLLSTAFVTALLVVPAQAQTADPNANRAEIARMEVRFTSMEEHMRQLRGKIEEVEFENRRLSEKLDLFQQDAELRFSEMEGNGPSAAITPNVPAEEKPAVTTPPKPTETQTLKVPKADAGGDFESSRDHYNHAFRLLNQTQYDDAGASFESFIQTYPNDPLIGNAYYWAGETYYVRKNYVQSADYFRRGYEALPAGPKAGDNLLKLAMSLSNLDRKTEACVVLKQVSAKFGGNSTTLRGKSETERNRLGCK